MLVLFIFDFYVNDFRKRTKQTKADRFIYLVIILALYLVHYDRLEVTHEKQMENFSSLHWFIYYFVDRMVVYFILYVHMKHEFSYICSLKTA